MTKTLKSLAAFAFLVAVLSSCQEDVDTKIVLNGNEVLSSPAPPALTQKDAYYEVLASNIARVIAADRSDPSDAVTQRRWVIKGPDQTTILEKNDLPGLEFVCSEPGWYSIYLEINEQKEAAQT